MKLVKSKIRKERHYSTARLFAVRNVLAAIKEAEEKGAEQGITLPSEQREMEDKNAAYKRKARLFVAFLLIQATNTDEDVSDIKRDLDRCFKTDVEVTPYIEQRIGLSIDELGRVFLSDGQHRFMHYLRDFFDGKLGIPLNMDFGDVDTNDAMQSVFEGIVLEDGEGNDKSNKELFITDIEDEIKQNMLDLPVSASVVKANSHEARVSLFISMNTMTNINTADIDHALFGNTAMWKAITEFFATFKQIEDGDKLTTPSGKIYNVSDTAAIQILIATKTTIKTFVPMVAHIGLLTILKRQMVKNYQWQYSGQNQAAQTKAFFDATKKMSYEECVEFMIKVTDSIVKVGRDMFKGDINTMKTLYTCRSLIVGQIHALANYKMHAIPKNEFNLIARGITNAISKNGYQLTPTGVKYEAKYFNNGHHSRKKNEMFFKLVSEAYDMRVERGDK